MLKIVHIIAVLGKIMFCPFLSFSTNDINGVFRISYSRKTHAPMRTEFTKEEHKGPCNTCEQTLLLFIFGINLPYHIPCTNTY